MNDRLSKLRDALDALGDEYTEAVMKLGRERNTEHPGEFRVVDFLAGASAVYLLLSEDGDRLTGPPAGWFLKLMFGRNPLYPDGDAPANPNMFRDQWLVLNLRPTLRSDAPPQVVASFTDSWDAEFMVEEARDADGDGYYTSVRVPYPGYVTPALAEGRKIAEGRHDQ